MSKKPQSLESKTSSKTQWFKLKCWSFILLGLNRTFNHDYHPPWGFEFLTRVDPEGWNQYHYYYQYQDQGFGSGEENRYAAEDDYPSASPEDAASAQSFVSSARSFSSRPSSSSSSSFFVRPSDRTFIYLKRQSSTSSQLDRPPSSPCPPPQPRPHQDSADISLEFHAYWAHQTDKQSHHHQHHHRQQQQGNDTSVSSSSQHTSDDSSQFSLYSQYRRRSDFFAAGFRDPRAWFE